MTITGATSIATGADDAIGLSIKGNSGSQTGDMVYIESSASGLLFKIEDDGITTASGITSTAAVTITGTLSSTGIATTAGSEEDGR